MVRRTSLVGWLVAVLLATLIAATNVASADSAVTATATSIAGVKIDRETPTAYEPRGVSSFAFIDRSGTYWLFANSGQGVQAHTSTDGRNWTRDTTWRAPGIGTSDITVVPIDPGYRMYFAEMASPSGGSGGGCSIKRVKSVHLLICVIGRLK